MPPHLSLRPRELAAALGVVLLGGALGTVVRDLALTWGPGGSGASWVARIPWTLLVINAVGVYVAVRLLRGPLRGRDPNDLRRLFVITGLLGGFTSYSSLVVAWDDLVHHNVAGGVSVAVLSVLSGVLAAAAGLRRSHR